MERRALKDKLCFAVDVTTIGFTIVCIILARLQRNVQKFVAPESSMADKATDLALVAAFVFGAVRFQTQLVLLSGSAMHPVAVAKSKSLALVHTFIGPRFSRSLEMQIVVISHHFYLISSAVSFVFQQIAVALDLYVRATSFRSLAYYYQAFLFAVAAPHVGALMVACAPVDAHVLITLASYAHKRTWSVPLAAPLTPAGCHARCCLATSENKP